MFEVKAGKYYTALDFLLLFDQAKRRVKRILRKKINFEFGKFLKKNFQTCTKKLNQMDSCKKILDPILENPPILCFADDVLEYDTLERILQITFRSTPRLFCIVFEKRQ